MELETEQASSHAASASNGRGNPTGQEGGEAGKGGGGGCTEGGGGVSQLFMCPYSPRKLFKYVFLRFHRNSQSPQPQHSLKVPSDCCQQQNSQSPQPQHSVKVLSDRCQQHTLSANSLKSGLSMACFRAYRHAAKHSNDHTPRSEVGMHTARTQHRQWLCQRLCTTCMWCRGVHAHARVICMWCRGVHVSAWTMGHVQYGELQQVRTASAKFMTRLAWLAGLTSFLATWQAT
jgi:hypothetical protein